MTNDSNVIISLKAINKHFKAKTSDVKALQNINLDIHKGEIFGIIGMSGAGKSTLIRCINLLEKPTSGNVFIDNIDLVSLDAKSICNVRQSIGMIFQGFNLLMQRNALKNVCFPLELAGVPKAEAKRRGLELLELVGLSDKQNAYPSQLSGGQKQRVAIARALATNPKILLCDEATSALDPDTTRSILSLLKEINVRLEITIVIITHQMSVIEEICDRVAILDNGSVVELSTVEEVFANPKSAVAKKLIYPNNLYIDHVFDKRCCRIVFNGEASYEPIVSDLILKFNAPINILFADIKNLDGKVFGQMIIQFSDNKEIYNNSMKYLKTQSLTCEELERYVH